MNLWREIIMNGKKLISIVGALAVMAATLVFAGCKQPAGGGAGGSGGGAASGAAIENTVWKVDFDVLKDVYMYYDSTTKRCIGAIKVGGSLYKQTGRCGTYKLEAGNKLNMTSELSANEVCTWKVEGNILTLSEPVNGRGTKTTEVTAAQLKAL